MRWCGQTIYDAASLTKVVATTPAVLLLHERGKLNIEDPVRKHLPEFSGKAEKITIRQLLTRTVDCARIFLLTAGPHVGVHCQVRRGNTARGAG